MRDLRIRALLCAVIVVVCLSPAPAQRLLSWDALDVEAWLDADGTLHLAETHAMDFTGDWNGGERTFNLRPGHRLTIEDIERIDSPATIPLTRDGDLDDVDDYAFMEQRILRWRSRLPSDPPFDKTRLTYVLRYRLQRIVQRDGDTYTLDHDFAFPDRVGEIRRYTLRLTLDSAWQPAEPIRESYTAGPLLPGDGFVLTIPMRYVGSGSPEVLDGRPPQEIAAATGALLGLTALAVLWFFLREHSLGRFRSVAAGDVDRPWIERHILSQPAEVIGAAWDEHTGADEVVALIARMTSEGKLESHAGSGSMTLRLLVDRESLADQERALVDGLFFDQRSETSTEAVKAHYQSAGFNPATLITPKIAPLVAALMPPGDPPRIWGWMNVLLFFAGAVLLGLAAYRGTDASEAIIVVIFAFIFIGVFLQFPGRLFQTSINWGALAALLCLIPAVAVASGVAAFLWYVVGGYRVELSPVMIGAIAALALAITQSSINGLKSRRGAAALAFRKKLAAAREYFRQELAKPIPSLRDDWYPWLLAFGLAKDVDRWSTSQPSTATRDRWPSSSTSSTSSSESTAWTGGGGRSGGAGASAAWVAAASGMAAGVSAPSSSSSGGSSGGSSSGGSSGGGGGGGW